MSNFWPEGVELTDTQSPREILETAQDDWRTGSDGVMALILQDTTSQSGNPMIIVHAKHIPNNRTARLFSVVHRPHKPYPATIQPEDDDLPEFLRKVEISDLVNPSVLVLQEEMLETIKGSRNGLWVSDTPSEFRRNLSKAFNLGGVKTTILNLASSSVVSANIDVDPSMEDSDK